jgi:hypothetical protein
MFSVGVLDDNLIKAGQLMGFKNSINRCNVVVKALCYKPEGRGFETR